MVSSKSEAKVSFSTSSPFDNIDATILSNTGLVSQRIILFQRIISQGVHEQHDRAYYEQMIQISVARMRAALDKAIEQPQREIRFIHGHGNGTLRDRVYHELRVYRQKGLIESFEPSFFNLGAVKCDDPLRIKGRNGKTPNR